MPEAEAAFESSVFEFGVLLKAILPFKTVRQCSRSFVRRSLSYLFAVVSHQNPFSDKFPLLETCLGEPYPTQSFRMRHKVKNITIQLLKAAFAVGLIVWLVQSGRLEFKDLTHLLELKYLIPLILLAGVNLAFGSERWRALLLAKGLQISRFGAARLTLIGTFFNFAMPGGVGGDVVKGFYITKHNPQARLTSVVTVVMDRLIGLYCMIFYALISMLLFSDYVIPNPNLRAIMSVLVIIFGVYSLAWIVVFSRRASQALQAEKWLPKLPMGKKLIHLYTDLTSYRHSKSVFLKTALLSLCAQTAAVFFFVIAGNGLGYHDVPLSIYFFVAPIGFMVTAIPISPAGVGVGQAAFFYLFNTVLGYESQLGPTAITAFQLANFFYGIIGAFFYLSLQRKMKQNP